MVQCFSRKREQPVLEKGPRPVLMSFVLALGHLGSFLLPDYLLPHKLLVHRLMPEPPDPPSRGCPGFQFFQLGELFRISSGLYSILPPGFGF